MNKVLEAALSYAAKGFEVFPVQGKRPVTPDGIGSATTNAEVITAWYTGHANWGIAVKIPDWAVVVDIDSDIGLKNLNDLGYQLPITLSSKSFKGNHYWYERKHANKALRRIGFVPFVDILVNGYVVVPPSKHPAGGEYKWESDAQLDRNNIEIAPQWIEASIAFEEEQNRGVDVDATLEGLPKGQRQTGLYRYACSLRARNAPISEAKALLSIVAKKSEGDGYEKYPDTDKLVERVYKQKSVAEKYKEKPDEIKVKTLADLGSARLEPTQYLVDKLLPATGYTLLTSPPKRGKSLIGAYVSLAVATGKPVWGLETIKSGVLYLDLEQEDEDAYERYKRISDYLGVDLPANFHIAFSWTGMDEGGLDKISEFLVDHPHVRLVVVDTLADLWPNEDFKGGNSYHREQKIVKKFIPLSRDFGCGFLVIHHDRKGDAEGRGDMIQQASGSYAITGKAKAVWHFQRDMGEYVAKLEVTGKNIPEREIDLAFREGNLVWTGRA